MMDSLNLIADIQAMFAFADGFLRWLSCHVYSRHYLLIAAVVFWTGYQRLAFRLAAATTLSTLLFIVVKPFFQAPRPYWLDDKLFNGLKESGYGMPSGHSQNAAVFGGIALCTIKKIGFTLAALLFIATIALSRVYLGVHFPSQVLVALAIGLTLVTLWVTLEPAIAGLLSNCSRYQQLVIGFAAALTPLVITLMHFFLFKSEGSAHAQHNLLFLMTGVAIGLVIYHVFCTTRYTPQLSFGLLLTRALPGAAVTTMLWQWSTMPMALIDSQTVLYSYSLARGCFLVLFVTQIWPRACEHIQPFLTTGKA